MIDQTYLNMREGGISLILENIPRQQTAELENGSIISQISWALKLM